MTNEGKDWFAYTYAWNEAQTDAELVPKEGGEIPLADGKKWKIPSRVDCMNCHSRASNFPTRPANRADESGISITAMISWTIS